MLVVMIFLFVLVGLIFFLGFLVGMITLKLCFCREKYSVFECGFDLLSFTRLPFCLHFYFISIIFLVFDVEVVLLLPFVFIFDFCGVYLFWLVFFCFFVVLVFGIFYEWYFGLLGWLF